MMKYLKQSLVFGIIAFVIIFPIVAFAQTTVDLSNVTIEDLLQQLLGSISTWKASGWIAGSVAVVNLLVNLTKYEPIDKWLSGLKIGWWLRPALSLFFGILLAFLAKYAGGASVGAAILVALVSGIGSTGFHELISIFNERVRIERATGAKIYEMLVTAKESAQPELSAPNQLKIKLNDIASLPTSSARLSALVEFAKSYELTKEEKKPA